MAQQSHDNAAANQDSNAAGSAFSAAQGADNGFLQSFFGQGGGSQLLSSLMTSLSGNQNATSMNNPYAQGAQGVGNSLAAGGQNGNMTSAQGSAAQLQNFNGLKPQEMAALQTQLGNSGQQTINSLRGQIGGTANPNATIQGLMGQNQQNVLNAGVQLGGQAAGQELSAQQSAGNLYSGLSGQNIGAMGAGGSLLSGLSSQLNGVNATELQGLLQSLGLSQQGAQFGTSNMAGIGGTYMNAGTAAGQAGQAAGNASASGFGQAGSSLSSLFTGGAAGAGGIGGLL
jgi:hypothetical protein